MAQENEFYVKVFDESDIRIKGDHLDFDTKGRVIKVIAADDTVVGIFSVENIIGVYDKNKSKVTEVGFGS